MTAQRQPQAAVIGNDVLALAQRAQQRYAFIDRRCRRQQRQRAVHARDLPYRAMPVPAELGQGIRGGQGLEIASIESGALGHIRNAVEGAYGPCGQKPRGALLRKMLHQAQP